MIIMTMVMMMMMMMMTTMMMMMIFWSFFFYRCLPTVFTKNTHYQMFFRMGVFVFHWCSRSIQINSLPLETSENTKYLLPFFFFITKKREKDNFNIFEEHRATSPTETQLPKKVLVITSAGDIDRRSKSFCFNAVFRVRFT